MNVENLIFPTGTLAVDPDYGIQVLTNYLFEISQVKAGVPFKELGISDRREASRVKIVSGDELLGNDISINEVTNGSKFGGKDKIAIVNISGLIQAEGGMSSVGMSQMADELLKQKNNVIGALFKINSGGGYTDGAEIMSAAIQEFGKPSVTVSNYAGSAAYMIASHTQQILAVSDLSSFGSIGVYYELNKVFRDKYNEMIDTAYSDHSPEKNSEWRQYLAGDLSGFVKLATAKDKMFMQLVRNNRMLDSSELTSETLLGGMFHAKEAKKRGLIDGSGDNGKAYSLIQKLSK